MTTILTATLAIRQQCDVGEGPVWDPRDQALYWVDITPGHLYRWQPGDIAPDLVAEVGQSLGCVVLRATGGRVLAQRDGLHVDRHGDGTTETLLSIDADVPHVTLNDGGCDRAGRLWVGSVSDDESPMSGCVYRVTPDLGLTRVVDHTTIANGVGWSPDDRTMYFSDSGTGTVSAFDYDLTTGTASDRRDFVVGDPTMGMPDGLAVDASGYVWVAYWGGWCVRRFSPDGQLDTVVELPASQISSCSFGGDNLDELYITTAAYSLSLDQCRREPSAGSVFRVRPGVHGQPPTYFAG